MFEGYAGLCNEISGKKCAVVGMGISNRPLPSFLLTAGATSVDCFDKKESAEVRTETENLRASGKTVSYYAGEDYLQKIGSGYDFIFRTPGVRPDTPELVKGGSVLTSEMEMFLKYCPATVFGVTGSDGKTTTTTLISLFLTEQSKNTSSNVYVGGNIGTPLLNKLPEMKPEDFVCVELSSFQLMNMTLGTDIAVITNISPNHLDYHRSYDEYIEAKASIFKFRKGTGVFVVNRGNEAIERYSVSSGITRTFSAKNNYSTTSSGAYLDNGEIYFTFEGKKEKILDVSSIRIPGFFNIENYMAAICATFDYVSKENIVKVAESFNGVHHRMEFVRKISGITFFNSSIDSSPNRTENTLGIFKEKVVLVAGGKDKGIPYDGLGKILADKVKAMILTGPTATKIEEAARNEFKKRNEEYNILTFHCNSYEDAVVTAYNTAKDGDTVILSPASTSFDMFKNFEERGNTFAALVNGLSEK